MIRNRPIKIPTSSPYRAPTLIAAIALLALLLLVLDRTGLAAPLRSRAEALLAPALVWVRSGGDMLGAIGAPPADVAALQAELAALRAENSRLAEQNIRMQALELENTRLREQLRIEEARPWQLVGAAVGVRTPDTGRRVITLAAGSDAGILPGMAVIAQEGGQQPALIGIVESAGPGSSTVLLITDYSSAVSGQIYRGGTIIAGIVQGRWQRGSRIRLEEIDREANVAIGDPVVTAGLTARLAGDLPRAAIPPNVPIGTVESISGEGRSIVAEIRPFVDPDRVRYAWIIVDAGK
jgi:rod shape-determining protein MreC